MDCCSLFLPGVWYEEHHCASRQLQTPHEGKGRLTGFCRMLKIGQHISAEDLLLLSECFDFCPIFHFYLHNFHAGIHFATIWGRKAAVTECRQVLSHVRWPVVIRSQCHIAVGCCGVHMCYLFIPKQMKPVEPPDCLRLIVLKKLWFILPRKNHLLCPIPLHRLKGMLFDLL